MMVVLETKARVVGNLYHRVFEERGNLYCITEPKPQFFPEGRHTQEFYYGSVELPQGRLIICLMEGTGLSFGTKSPFSSVVCKFDGRSPEVSFPNSAGELVCLGEGNAAMIRVYARDRGSSIHAQFTIKEYGLRCRPSQIKIVLNVRRGDFNSLVRHFPQYRSAMLMASQRLRHYIQTLRPSAGSKTQEVKPAART